MLKHFCPITEGDIHVIQNTYDRINVSKLEI